MSPTRGRRIALTVGFLALVALVVTGVAGVAGKDHLREQWYLWRLSSADEATRDHAADALGALKSVPAVPVLIRVLRGWPERQRAFALVLVNEPPGEVVALDAVAYAIFQIDPGRRLPKEAPVP